MTKLFESGANSITTLEGQNITHTDVFYVWVTIAWHLEQVLVDLENDVSQYWSQVVQIYNDCFNQMMTETSHQLFLLGYVLHPLYFLNGGLQLAMPLIQDGEMPTHSQYSDLFATICQAALSILSAEHICTGMKNGKKSEFEDLIQQLLHWVYGLPPFTSRSFFLLKDSALNYWEQLGKDSGASILAKVTVIIFSIMPSKLCDQCAASLLGWINAVHQSLMTPEHLIECAQLSQWYKFGLTEGDYQHIATANVKVSPVEASLVLLSAPTLMDLLNDHELLPKDVDQDALQEAFFKALDPYDLHKTEHLDAVHAADPIDEDGRFVLQSSDRWAVSAFIKLDSPALQELIMPLRMSETASEKTVLLSNNIEEEEFDDNDLAL
ncbi:hypothetical protein GYMLUDRAFT_250685 [Collybiopsis luxurians FD-317 M1]|uniref:Uncharacterized protein n=1 Tax=Collybiopsis luxurians FD-317 M1 TaxID=944289 RepID=A0A0D0BU25_9AGAR|nr:hypothetical protein GYMLUDRAFT_250685 [Collybiopsis luxurians FD-317 M1]